MGRLKRACPKKYGRYHQLCNKIILKQRMSLFHILNDENSVKVGHIII